MSEPKPGYIYVLIHDAWFIGLGENRSQMVKIGYTTRHPTRRALEITTVSGLVKPCTVAFMIRVDDCKAVERAAHRILSHRRIRGRELFKVDVQTAVRAINDVRHISGNLPVWTDQRPPALPMSLHKAPMVSRTTWLIGAVFLLIIIAAFSSQG